MALLVAKPIDALQQPMAELRHAVNGKRKAPSPLPNGAQIIDLTVEDDDIKPVAKRQKSQSAEDDNKSRLPSRTRDHTSLSTHQKLQTQIYETLFASTEPSTLLHASSQSQKQGPFKSATSQNLRPFNSLQYTGVPSNNGIPDSGTRPATSSPATGTVPSTPAAPEIPLPQEWERRVNANGKVYYLNHKTKTTSWNPPTPVQTAESSYKKAVNAAGIQRRRIASRTASESEDVLQEFRLPQTTAIKFEADASPASAVPRNKPAHTTHKSDHQKKQSYDHTDVERVKTIFSSPPRPRSSPSTRPATPQPRNGAIPQRKSQREIKAPKRLVTEKYQSVKATDLPSRTATLRIEAQRREQTPPRSQISVVIPASQHRTKPPVVNLEEDQDRKRSLLRDMERDVAVVRERAKSVENYFGTTGFSAIYGTASDDERLKKIHKLQIKVKKVRRNDIKLDWGVVDKATTTAFRHEDLIHPRDQIRKAMNGRVTSVAPGPPLTFVNDIDDHHLNGKFQFVSDYVIREGVRRQPAHVNEHINCSESCTGVCSPSTCSCLRNDKMQDFTGYPVPTYRHRPDGLIILNDVFITLSKEESAWTEIVECNNNCRCDKGCYNRVVQRGRTLPLEIFMTKACGFGLRCPRDIVKGQFIDLYLGEVVTEAMLIQRENAQEEGEPSYLFTLDWFNENPNYVHYQIDGANFGTPMRFINHSCNSNCGVFPVMLKEYDQNIYGLAVFALKDIPAMTELTLDYAPQLEYIDPADCVKCQCGEKNCRGYLWPKNTKRARRRKVLRG